MCNNWPNFPFSVEGATGGLIGNTVMVCGGYDKISYVDKCYSLTSQGKTLVTHMSLGKMDAASIVLNDNILWVTGGYNYFYQIPTEYVTMTGTMPGPDLPKGLSDHAMVAINSTCTMVAGGFDSGGYSATTYFYDHSEGEWITGPSLIQARYDHAAGIVIDEVTDEQFVIVTGGYFQLDSTEILQDGNWIQGKINDIICVIFLKLGPLSTK
jgi:hypothetical protein